MGEKLGDDLQFDLSRGTLLYGEIVKEMRGEGRSQRKVTAFHIVDAIFLGEEDLRQRDLVERNELCRIFAKAMNKTNMPHYIHIRSKESFSMQYLPEKISKHMHGRLLKGYIRKPKITYDVNHSEKMNINKQNVSYIVPMGIMCLRITKEPWMRTISKSTKRYYWYNVEDKRSLYEYPQEAKIDALSSFPARLLWNWDQGVKISKEQDIPIDESKLQAEQMIQFIEQKL